MRSLLILMLSVLLYINAHSQGSMEEYLGSPVTDVDYKTLQMQQEFLSTHKFNSPWLRELDFRMRAKGLEPDIDEYRMRLGLLNPLEIKANKTYNDLINQQHQLKNRTVINDLLLRRYQVLIEHYFISKRNQLLTDYQAKLEVQRQLVLELEGSVRELIQIEEQMTKLELENLSVQQMLNLLNENIARSAGIPDWSDHQIPSKESIMQTINQSADGELLVSEAEQDLKVREQLLRLEKAEAFSNIGFIQGEYDLDQGDNPRDHMGMQLGIQVPIFNVDRPKIQREELSLLDERAEAENAQTELSFRKSNQLINLQGIQAQLEWISQKQESIKKYEQLSEEISGDLETLIELADYQFYLDQKHLELQSDLLMHYIKYLHLAGRLSEMPYQNYLSAFQDEFEAQF